MFYHKLDMGSSDQLRRSPSSKDSRRREDSSYDEAAMVFVSRLHISYLCSEMALVFPEAVARS